MELRHLKHFIGVAEELHFGRAADRLHIEQSPLSRSIRDLENDLGVKLFDRTTRSTKLTDAGAIFLREARQVLLAAEKARLCITGNLHFQSTTIRIAITENFAHPYTTKLFELVQKENPTIQIHISEIDETQLVTSLKSGRIDAAISPINIAMEGFTAIPLWREALVALIPFQHQLSSNNAISLEEIYSHPLILLKPISQQTLREIAIKKTRQDTRKITTIENASSLEMLLLLMNVTRGIGVITESKLSKTNHSNVQIKPFIAPTPKITSYLTVSKQTQKKYLTRSTASFYYKLVKSLSIATNSSKNN